MVVLVWFYLGLYEGRRSYNGGVGLIWLKIPQWWNGLGLAWVLMRVEDASMVEWVWFDLDLNEVWCGFGECSWYVKWVKVVWWIEVEDEDITMDEDTSVVEWVRFDLDLEKVEDALIVEWVRFDLGLNEG
ncbi:unnamed protein product [Dovyalis caffra]|uniref:Uncharacterized protein n=1 Tax=Dovyalis caffra TaxID=77055 RepID=A0AAV1RQJ0_9ROSI|nr:unnamed protein product [Dovyalis caffra]